MESHRYSGGTVAQRHVLYLGDGAQRRWPTRRVARRARRSRGNSTTANAAPGSARCPSSTKRKASLASSPCFPPAASRLPTARRRSGCAWTPCGSTASANGARAGWATNSGAPSTSMTFSALACLPPAKATIGKSPAHPRPLPTARPRKRAAPAPSLIFHYSLGRLVRRQCSRRARRHPLPLPRPDARAQVPRIAIRPPALPLERLLRRALRSPALRSDQHLLRIERA